MGTSILSLMIILAILTPAIIFWIILGIIIWLIVTKKIRNKTIKVSLIIIILVSVGIVSVNIKDERPNDLCVKVREYDKKKSLIGLSKEKIDIKLGKPIGEGDLKNNKKRYTYRGGELSKGMFLFKHCILWDTSYGCILNVVVNENDIVEQTSIEYID